jgi:hypothetical protein
VGWGASGNWALGVWDAAGGVGTGCERGFATGFS